MVRYIEKVMAPYVDRTHKELGTASPPLLIFDVFTTHRTEEVAQAIKNIGAPCVFVPPRCTDHFQPLDATVNKYKQLMRAQFQSWFAEKVAVMVTEGHTTQEIAEAVDLRTATIKPVHTKWLINCQRKGASEAGFCCDRNHKGC